MADHHIVSVEIWVANLEYIHGLYYHLRAGFDEFGKINDFWCFRHHGDWCELEVEIEDDDEFHGGERWFTFQWFPVFLECFLHFHSLEELYGVSAAVHLPDALYIALQFLWLIGILLP